MNKNCISKVLMYVMLIITFILSVFPLYWMIVSTTNSSADVLNGRLLPGNYLLTNLQTFFQNYDLITALKNSLVYAVLSTVFSLLICSLAGYGFEIYHDKIKDKIISIILLAMMVPFITILFPLYKMFATAKLVNSMIAMLLPTLSTPFLIMLFRNSTRNFPYEIIEAARIDGMSEGNIFFHIYIPTMRSTFAAAMTITFMNAWNNFLWPKVIAQSPSSQTMTMLVASTIGGNLTNYGEVMVSVTICTIPTVVLFFFMQKSFANGISGAVKM